MNTETEEKIGYFNTISNSYLHCKYEIDKLERFVAAVSKDETSVRIFIDTPQDDQEGYNPKAFSTGKEIVQLLIKGLEEKITALKAEQQEIDNKLSSLPMPTDV